LREVVDDGYLPLHYAVAYKSTTFCKELIDAYPESLRVESGDGSLPILVACSGNRDDTADTIQYMLELDSELINVEDSAGLLPIHRASNLNEGTKSIKILLKFDPEAASKETNNDGYRWLPLHLACSYDTNLSSIQVLYDAYPEAILISEEHGYTPLNIARLGSRNQPTIDFLQTQLVYARQAQDMTAMTTVDDDGRLSLHNALKDDAPLGSIKLLTRANPAALQVADQNGVYPVHIASEFSSVNVVKYLVELAGDTLNNVDAKNNSPLHYACRGGKCDVVKYLLEANVPSVSDRNNNNKLAIHLLLECEEETLDRESMEYVETVRQLILANPEVVRDFMPY
jgi:ankyrin repeat protein